MLIKVKARTFCMLELPWRKVRPMSLDASSPHPLLDLDAQALLARAYSLRSEKDSRALYRDWATTYDQTMVDALQYRSPTVVAEMLRPHLTSRQARVLDIGCGVLPNSAVSTADCSAPHHKPMFGACTQVRPRWVSASTFLT